MRVVWKHWSKTHKIKTNTIENYTMAGRGISQDPLRTLLRALRTLLRASCSSFFIPISSIIVFSIHVFTPLSSINVFSIHVLTPLSSIIELSIDICAQVWSIIAFFFVQNVHPWTMMAIAYPSVKLWYVGILFEAIAIVVLGCTFWTKKNKL